MKGFSRSDFTQEQWENRQWKPNQEILNQPKEKTNSFRIEITFDMSKVVFGATPNAIMRCVLQTIVPRLIDDAMKCIENLKIRIERKDNDTNEVMVATEPRPW